MLRKVWDTLKLAYFTTTTKALAHAKQSDEPKPPDKPGDNSQASAEAYAVVVSHVINRPDGIRLRAQVSASISAAAAAALVGFGGLGNLEAIPWYVRALVALAILAWLWSLLRYIQAIAYSYYEDNQQTTGSPGEKKDIDGMLTEFLQYAMRMRCMVGRGTAATKAAILATLIAGMALLVNSNASRSDRPVMVFLTKPGLKAIRPACDLEMQRTVHAQVRQEKLTLAVVPLRLPIDVCCKVKEVTVYVRRSRISAVREGWPTRPSSHPVMPSRTSSRGAAPKLC